jgi:gamma-glutamylcyclotransferase (GGCT)/AIG2-like uncharacterized protein YtfP
VWGALFDVGLGGFEKLDEYEGVPTAYDRELWTVTAADGSSVSAVVYTVATKQIETLPSHRYWKLLVDGAREADLPSEYIAVLERIAYHRDP